MATKKLARPQSRGEKTRRADAPPSPAAFIRGQLAGVPRGEALGYLDSLLQHAEDCVTDSLPKLLGDIKPSQYPAFSAINTIEAVRHGLRLIGGAS